MHQINDGGYSIYLYCFQELINGKASIMLDINIKKFKHLLPLL